MQTNNTPSSCGGEIGIAIELGAAERPALVPVADGIGGKRFLRGERGGGIVLGTAGRPVAVTEGRLVIPPAAFIVGCAEEDLETNVRVIEADAHELHQVL